MAAVGSEGLWLGAMDSLKAAAHFGALLAMWVWPLRLMRIWLIVSGVDLVADFTSSVLLGGLYESGLQIMWSVISVLALLIISTVRVAAGFFAVTLVSVVLVTLTSSWVEPRYTLPDPQTRGAFVIVAVLLFVFLSLFYFVRQRDRFQRESDDLLRNILPDEIAARLKRGKELIADQFDDVSVMFVDVVDFTPMSASMAPTELVGFLDEVFSDIDSFVVEMGLEKIKTVGDEYMVAAGVPTPRSDHAHVIADLALRVHNRFATHQYAGRHIEVRIGINSGQVVAGIIGRRKFSYDLWGDVVNIASRMESHGEAGAIQISTATYEHIKGDFRCEPRGAIEVKGKGALETWFLIDREIAPTALED